MPTNIYIVDTTVLEDYYIVKNNIVKKWVNEIYAQSIDRILILPTILFEMIRRTHYYRNDDPELIERFLLHLKGLSSVEIGNHNDRSIKQLIKNLKTLSKSRNEELDIGEFTFLQELSTNNIILVTSDKKALTAYRNSHRLDPRFDPPMELLVGEEMHPIQS